MGPWLGCVLPGVDDFLELGEVDLSRLDAHGLLALSKTLGVVPMSVEKKPLTSEVLRRAIEEHLVSA